MKLPAYLDDLLSGRRVLFSAPGVGRQFMLCHSCHRVVPMWKLSGRRKSRRQRFGCKCGAQDVVSRTVNGVIAAWWVFVRGLLIRRLICQREDWDPRCPIRL